MTLLLPQEFHCEHDSNCTVTGSSRKLCNWCRFQKCLSVGMKIELVHSDLKLKPNQANNVCLQKLQLSAKENDTSSSSEKTLNTESDVSYFVEELDTSEKVSTSAPIFMEKSLLSLTNEFVYFKRPIGTNIQFTLINVNVRTGCFYSATIEVPVKNGTILGTELSFNNLFVKQDTQAWNNGWILYVSSIQGSHTFHHASSCLQTSFDVRVTSHRGCKVSFMIMELLTEEHWKRLSEVASAAKFFQESLGIQELPSVDIAAHDDSVLLKRLLLFASNDNWGKQITGGIESLELFRNLCFEDQLIILKESYFTVRALSFTHTFIKEENSFVLNSPLGEYLLLCFHINTRKAECNKMYDMYTTFLNEFYDFLRKDCIVITIMCILFVYDEYSGMTCDWLIKKERKLYTELLQKYIDAKIKSGQWSLNSFEIWDHIWRIKKQLLSWRPVYDQCARSLYSNNRCQS